MTNLKYFFRMLSTSLGVLLNRLVGKKQHPNWDLSTELVWATTRLTLTSSNHYGLPWLKDLSVKFVPKPKLADQVLIEKVDFLDQYYLKVRGKGNEEGKGKTLIYFHGGGYVIGSAEASLEFVTRLALETKATILVPAYPRAPEKTYPAAHQFAFDLVQATLSEASSPIVLAGDSAGAALVLSSFLNLSPTAQKQVSRCVLISPWIDPLAKGGSIDSNSQNDVGDRDFVVACHDLYVQDTPITEQFPLAFLDRDLSSLPPTLVSIGSAEILLDQSQDLVQQMQEQGVAVHSKVFPGMFHTFWNLAPTIKEAEELVKDIATWLEE